MDVLIGIGMLVMMPMLRRPPECPLLRRGAAQEGEAKLEEAARFIASMGEITMKSPGDPKFANEEYESAERHSLQIYARPKHGEARQVNHDKKNASKSDVKAASHTDFVLFRNPVRSISN